MQLKYHSITLTSNNSMLQLNISTRIYLLINSVCIPARLNNGNTFDLYIFSPC